MSAGGQFGTIVPPEGLPSQATLRAMYDRCGIVINARQAEALAALVWEGHLKGTTYPRVEPPRAVALFPLTPDRGGLPGEEVMQDRVTGDYIVDWDHPESDRKTGRGVLKMEPAYPEAHTLGVVSPDGRLWQIARAGICWPMVPPAPAADGA